MQSSVEPPPATSPIADPLLEVTDPTPTRGPNVGSPKPPTPSRRKRNLAIIAALIVAIGVGAFAYNRYTNGAVEKNPFETVEVRQGDLIAMVSATGALSAVGTVEVGTQVSGLLEHVFADFNDRVAEGDLLAIISTEALDAVVQDNEATVNRSQATLRQTEAELGRTQSLLDQARAQHAEAQELFERNQLLFDAGAISVQEYTSRQTAEKTTTAGMEASEAQVAAAEAGTASARAAVSSAEAKLAQVRKNRRNAEIRAPISGVVIERTVESGQTVAASFATPKLFIIAEDLAEMEILAHVDESDIGLVKSGQSVEFTVAAYPGKTFSGVVRERRLQPRTIQNVVHYTVVVTADNQGGLLLPGMTATLDFIVDELREALLVPASALLFDPPDEIREAARKKQREASEAQSETSDDSGTAFSADVAEIWIPSGERELRPMLVRVLSSNGAATAIAALPSSPEPLEPGLEVVTRMNQTEGGSFNPFSSRR